MAWTASAPLEGGMACRVTRRANARRASCLFSPEEANAVHKRPPAEVDELNCPDKTAAGLRCCQNCHTFDLWPLCFDRCMGFFQFLVGKWEPRRDIMVAQKWKEVALVLTRQCGNRSTGSQSGKISRWCPRKGWRVTLLASCNLTASPVFGFVGNRPLDHCIFLNWFVPLPLPIWPAQVICCQKKCSNNTFTSSVVAWLEYVIENSSWCSDHDKRRRKPQISNCQVAQLTKTH